MGTMADKMKIEYTSRQLPKNTTDLNPLLFELDLNAKGTYQEIEWLKKQIDKIGKK